MKKIVAFCVLFVLLCASLFAYSLTLEYSDASEVAGAKSPTPTPAQSHEILYVSDLTGDNEIYRMDLSSKKTVNLTNNEADDMNPQVSPDGKYIVFYSDRDGDNEIYKMELATGEVTQLTKNSIEDFDPAYSPNGKEIVFKSLRSDRLGDIFTMTDTGARQRNLTKSMNTTEEWDPTFSPDGEKIYFVQRNNSDHFTDEIFVMDKTGQNPTQITSNSVPDWYPSLNKKGMMTFVSRENQEENDSIYSLSLEKNERINLSILRGNDADPAWDMRGENIIFINDQDGDYDLYMLNLKKGTIEKILSTPNIELSPIFH